MGNFTYLQGIHIYCFSNNFDADFLSELIGKWVSGETITISSIYYGVGDKLNRETYLTLG